MWLRRRCSLLRRLLRILRSPRLPQVRLPGGCCPGLILSPWTGGGDGDGVDGESQETEALLQLQSLFPNPWTGGGDGDRDDDGESQETKVLLQLQGLKRVCCCCCRPSCLAAVHLPPHPKVLQSP